MPRTNVDSISKLIRRFNDWVRGELRTKKVKQSDLAEYLNISQPIVSLRLRGLSEWPLRDALKVCEYFETSIEEII